jgi:hypothetical protein
LHDDVARMLVRHQWVRDHGTPRITVLCGAPGAAVARWVEWTKLTGRQGAWSRAWDPGSAADATWLAGATRQALDICQNDPSKPVAIVCPRDPVDAFLTGRDDRISTILREGIILVPRRSATTAAKQRPDGAARSLAELTLHEALEGTPATHGRFELNGLLSTAFGNRGAEVDLLGRLDGIAVEIDGYHHFRDADAYRRDRRKDAVLQGSGYIVLRFLAEDVMTDARPAVRRVVEALAWRLRAKGIR